MKTFVLVLLLTVGVVAHAFGDDQQKAESQLNKMNGMAAYTTIRRFVNLTLADQFNVKRSALVQQRQELNLNYGNLFLLHEVLAHGAKIEDVTAELKKGKNLVQIANDQRLDWKQIAAEGKRVNGKIEENLYGYLIRDKADMAHETAESYVPATDSAPADMGARQKDTDAAQDTYDHWRELAGKRAGVENTSLDHLTEKNASQGHDQIKMGAPGSPESGTPNPAAKN
jgi:hypothetical protein